MKNKNNLETHLSFEGLPNAVQALNVKMDKILESIVSSKPDQQENKLLTIDQAAKFLNLSKSTVYSKVSKGELPYMKKGKRLYFSQEELVGYIKSGKIKTVDEIENDVDDFLSKNRA